MESKFKISLHIRDLSLLLQIQEFFGGIGLISISNTQNMVTYLVSKLNDLNNVIIPHFEKYCLLTQKGADFILWKQVVELMLNKEHLTIKGILKIISIKASINLGLSDEKYNYSNITITPINRPIINYKNISDPNWISGFVSGEGNFDVNIHKSNTKIGFRVRLRFRISQHERDLKLMENTIKYLGSGYIEKDSRKPAISLTIVKFSDIINKIIPLFENNSLFGVKKLDYLDWCKVAKLINEGKHLTLEGLNLIRSIKSGMNKGRKY